MIGVGLVSICDTLNDLLGKFTKFSVCTISWSANLGAGKADLVRLAETRGTTRAIRSYAQLMVSSHITVNNALTAILKNKAPAPPPTLLKAAYSLDPTANCNRAHKLASSPKRTIRNFILIESGAWLLITDLASYQIVHERPAAEMIIEDTGLGIPRTEQSSWCK
jgi:hypothetical protein